MQLKHIGIAVVIVGGTLVADSLWTRTDHIDGFEVATKDSSFDADTNTDSARAGRFDPYTQGRRADRFDPHTEAAARHAVYLLLTQGNT
ncbi:hypothetical protein AWV79_20440 [Cupriavidus sp. UYMMa02A]|nr:hypothetical protein AWV79_20440 [Cupriavidus sp. UYMMa02A]